MEDFDAILNTLYFAEFHIPQPPRNPITGRLQHYRLLDFGVELLLTDDYRHKGTTCFIPAPYAVEYHDDDDGHHILLDYRNSKFLPSPALGHFCCALSGDTPNRNIDSILEISIS